MDFALKVLLSFLVGGAYVSGVIWLSERLGSRLGGAVAGLPSTILVGLIFINITEGSADAREAVAVVPLMFAATLIYGLVFVRAVMKPQAFNGLIASLFATLAWLAVALLVRPFSDISFLVIVLLALLGLGIFRYVFHGFSTKLPSKIVLPRYAYLLRFVISGGVIASAVLAARLAGPVWGGIVSGFPAMLGSILYFLNKSQGGIFLKGFLRRLPASYISSLIFLIIVHQTLTNWNTALSFAVAITGAILYTSTIILIKPTQK